MGAEEAYKALVWGLLAALSLPLGATAGILASPVSEKTIATCMAFGAGALIFAVSIELYAEAIVELRDGNGKWEVIVQSIATVAGGALYVFMDNFLIHRGDTVREARKHFGLQSLHDREDAADADPRVAAVVPDDEEKASLLGYGEQRLSRERGPTREREHEPTLVLESVGGSFLPGRNRNFAIILWCASWLDTLPQCILIGFLQGEGRIKISFVLSAFIANFPQSYASGSMLMEQKANPCRILAMWSLVWVVGGFCAMLMGWVVPSELTSGGTGDVVKRVIAAAIMGLTGGAMIAFISATMLPAAFEKGGRSVQLSGLLCTLGFVASMTFELFTAPSDETIVPP